VFALIACGGGAAPRARRQARLEQQPGQAATVDKLSRRELTHGAIVGSFGEHTSHVWRGIPYAQPPVGALRWQAPRPIEPWEDVREMLVEAPQCVQLGAEPGTAGSPPPIVGQEDCLYLDVYAPAMNNNLAITRRLPVVLWIHGGGNLRGSARDYDAGRLALQRQVLVVVPNYRLGPLGWFSHSALQGEPPAPPPPVEAAPSGEVGHYLTPAQTAAAALASDDRSGNYGTLDLIAALIFVRENIARFGGDPDNVTLAGDGTGGGNVLSLLLSPRAKGLFRQAIAQSPHLSIVTLAEAREQAQQLTAGVDPAQVAEHLRALPAAVLFAAGVQPRAAGDDRALQWPNALRDGAVVGADPPLERFARGDYHQVPIVLGSNRDEAKRDQASNPELVVAEPGGPRILDPARYALLAEYRSEAQRATGVNALAALLHEAQGDSVFVYRFDWDEEPSSPIDYSLLLGAAHGLELDFVLGVFDPREQGRLYSDANARGRAKLSRHIMAYWAELAYSGEPGSGRMNDIEEWTPWGEGGDVLVLDTKAGGDLRMERGRAGDLAGLLARLARDRRAPLAIDKCRVLFWLTERGSVPRSAYLGTPGIDCRAYPIERYPF
jgi:para-nitrobenzyl esterase